MRWMVNARNKIEKQGDLEIHSFVRAEIIASHMNEEVLGIQVPAQLFDETKTIFDRLPRGEIGAHIFKHGVLRIQRRWVENSLSQYELLDATAIAYGRISQIVHDAHRQIGLDVPTTTNMETGQEFVAGAREGKLPCMIGHAEARSLHVKLSDGSLFQVARVNRNIDKDDAKLIAERYGDAHRNMFGPKNAGNEQIARSLFLTARRVFEIDGYHQSMIFLVREGKVVHLFGIRPEDHAEKYMVMRTVADEVAKYDADAVIQLGEIWLAPADPLNPFQRPEESPKREEAITATLVSKFGQPLMLSAQIVREGETVNLAETQEIRDEAAFLFSSVYETWGRSIPDEWISQIDEFGKSGKQTIG